MQDFHIMQELSDEELAVISGGHRYHGAPLTNQSTPIDIQNASTSAGVSVNAQASGGVLHLDSVITQTKSITIHEHGESVSIAVGFALGIAL